MAANTTDYRAIIGRQLKKFRIEAGMTQLDVSERCGLFRTYLSRLEMGKANPTITVLVALADTLRVDVRELLAEDDSD